METKRKQMAKNNRIIVPFYSPPLRQYGQTPSEIIREARASVINLPASGTKPVPTNRPFTPKERERTLFGNVEKKLMRPPSSFSLRYLQKPDTLPRIKLPAIDIDYNNKVYRNSCQRSVSYLDHVAEEFDADIARERRQLDIESHLVFPGVRPSSLERKTIDTLSVRENIVFRGEDRRCKSSFSEICSVDTGLNLPDNSCSIQSDDFTEFSPDFFLTKGLEKDISQEPPILSNLESQRTTAADVKQGIQTDLIEFSVSSAEKNLSEMVSNIDDTVNGGRKIDKKKNILEKGNIDGSRQAGIQSTYDEIKADVLKAFHDNKNDTWHRQENMQQNGYVGDEIIHFNDTFHADTVPSAEKCTVTELSSDYLSMLQNPQHNTVSLETRKSKEIVELYETAKYYGVELNPKVPKKENSEKQIEHLEDPKNDLSPLQRIKDNIKNFDEKIKKLNHGIESLEEKLMTNNIYVSNESGNNNKDVESPEDFTFRMNNSKRYHISGKREAENSLKHNRPYVPVAVEKEKSTGWDGFWKNSYYRQTSDSEKLSQSILNHAQGEEFKVDSLDRHIIWLTQINNSCTETQKIVHSLQKFHSFLKSEGIFSTTSTTINTTTSNNNNNTKEETKIRILKCLYNFADNEEPEILLNLARTVFALKMESSLSAACKMVFKVARSDANDHLFLNSEDILELFVEGIGRSSPLDAAESCIYGYGALKFLTMNHTILSRLTNLGLLDLLVLHLKLINSAKQDGRKVNDQSQHALFQLTGAIRNIAAGEGTISLFISTNSIPVLYENLKHFRHSEDLVTNIARILSFISTDEGAVQSLVSIKNILVLMTELLDHFKYNDKILIRLSYSLGNIVALNDLARIQLARLEESMVILIKILEVYLEKDMELAMNKTDETETSVVDDILVKVIRIIANMCMNPVVGSNLAPTEGNERSQRLLHLLATILQRKDTGITLLACLGCLNNISYYCDNHGCLTEIAEGIVRVLKTPDEECQAEAVTVLGNLSRHKEIRDLICKMGGIAHLSILLESRNKEVQRSTCGVLVNLMLDCESRKAFVKSHGIDKLIGILDKFSEDWQMAGLICRAIWNSCVDDLEDVINPDNLTNLVNILANSLDEENWNDGDEDWEEFACLATDLLEKMNTYMELIS